MNTLIGKPRFADTVDDFEALAMLHTSRELADACERITKVPDTEEELWALLTQEMERGNV